MRGPVTGTVSGDVEGDDAGVSVAEDAGPGAVAGVSGVTASGGGPRGEEAGGVGDRGLEAEERGFVRIGRNGVVWGEGEEEHEEEKLREGIPFDQ